MKTMLSPPSVSTARLLMSTTAVRLLFALPMLVSSQDIAAPSANTGMEDVYCLTLHEDLMRRQIDEWGSSAPFTIDDGTKHTPFTTFDDVTRQATVVVGNGDEAGGVYHPMVASDNPTTVHFITHIYLLDQNQQMFAVEVMDPNMPEPATVVFDVPKEVTEVTALEFCNLHGLWVGPTIETPYVGDTTTTTTEEEEEPAVMPELGDSNSTTLTVEEKTAEDMEEANGLIAVEEGDGDGDTAAFAAMMCHIDSPLNVAYDSFHADFVRRQSLPPFNNLNPFTEEDGAKHTPYISIDDDKKTATITVGVEGNYHVMKGSARELDENGDPVEPHWITEIWVVDQTGTILTMESLNPTGVDIAQITMDIPDSATTLTAYEWCNIHGLYVGPTVSVETGEVVVVADEEDDEANDLESSSGGMASSKQQQALIMKAAAMMAAAAPLMI